MIVRLQQQLYNKVKPEFSNSMIVCLTLVAGKLRSMSTGRFSIWSQI